MPSDVYPKVAGILKNLTKYSELTTPLLGKKIKKSTKVFNDTKVLEGWRYDIFGKTALYFVSGKIAISSSKNTIVLKKL